MLTDHAKQRLEQALREVRDGQVASEWGDYIRRMMAWAWFVTLTFRFPNSMAWAVAQVERFLSEIEEAARQPNAWIFMGDRGRLGDRLHFHGLIAGVDHLSAEEWQRRAFRRFGYASIAHYDNELGGAHYIAQKIRLGGDNIHIGGALFDSAETPSSGAPVGRIVIARSAELPRQLFHMTLGRRRKV